MTILYNEYIIQCISIFFLFDTRLFWHFKNDKLLIPLLPLLPMCIFNIYIYVLFEIFRN